VVYVALGSCGTAAGLIAGLAPSTAVVGVRVVDRLIANGAATRRLAARTLALVSAGEPRRPLAPLRVEHGFFGGAYGRATPAAESAQARAAAHGLGLEPTYTGKAMAALLADAEAGRLDGKRVLFVHTYNGVDLQPLLAGATPPLLVGRAAGAT
jgi:D-cysteine desulfhydrase